MFIDRARFSVWLSYGKSLRLSAKRLDNDWKEIFFESCPPARDRRYELIANPSINWFINESKYSVLQWMFFLFLSVFDIWELQEELYRIWSSGPTKILRVICLWFSYFRAGQGSDYLFCRVVLICYFIVTFEGLLWKTRSDARSN